MTQLEWQQLGAAVADMTDEEKHRLAALLRPNEQKQEMRPDPTLGLFTDEPKLIEYVFQQTYLARETHSLRTSDL